MTISNTARDYKKESIKKELGKVKSEMSDIIRMIESIENEEMNMTSGIEFVHRTQRITQLISHLNRKAVNMQISLNDYAFIVGIERGEEGAAQ